MWNKRAVFRLNEKKVFHSFTAIDFLKELDYEELSNISTTKAFFNWVDEKSKGFAETFQLRTKANLKKEELKKVKDFFKGFVGEFFFATLLDDVKVFALKNYKGERKLYTFRNVELSDLTDYGVDLTAEVDCLDESKKVAIQVKFWNPDFPKTLKDKDIVSDLGQAIMDGQISVDEYENFFWCWLGEEKNVSDWFKKNTNPFKHTVFFGMEDLDININNKNPTFWKTTLPNSFRNL